MNRSKASHLSVRNMSAEWKDPKTYIVYIEEDYITDFGNTDDLEKENLIFQLMSNSWVLAPQKVRVWVYNKKNKNDLKYTFSYFPRDRNIGTVSIL